MVFIQWHTVLRWGARKLEIYKVHDVAKIAACQGTGWLQAHSECSIVLQNFCPDDACACGTCIGNSPASGTTWISQRASDWRTFIDCEFGGGWLLAVRTPIWIVSLDLSKAFDRVTWDKLRVALQARGVSDHLVWAMQNLYTGQLIQGDIGDSRVFAITAGDASVQSMFGGRPQWIGCISQN